MTGLGKPMRHTLARLYRENGAVPNYNRTGFEWPSDGSSIHARLFLPLMISGFVEVKESRLQPTARGRELIHEMVVAFHADHGEEYP